jgi:hypothetical protein
MSQYLSIPNWENLQHYKDRTPPWIKLHNELLEDYEFECLPDASKAHLLCIWLLASRTENKIKADSRWIQRKIGANSDVDIKGLVDAGFLQLNQEVTECKQDASNMPQVMQQSAIPEREGEERESRVEGDSKPAKKSGRSVFVIPTPEELVSYFMSKESTSAEAQKFFNFYESKGWKVGKNKMEKWKSSASGWITRSKDNKSAFTNQTPDVNGFVQISSQGKSFDQLMGEVIK